MLNPSRWGLGGRQRARIEFYQVQTQKYPTLQSEGNNRLEQHPVGASTAQQWGETIYSLINDEKWLNFVSYGIAKSQKSQSAIH